MALAPLAIFVPVLAATVLVGAGRYMPRRLADVVALAAAVACAVLCALLLARVWDGHTSVQWAGGWHPRQHGTVAVGISLAVDQLGAGAATFAAVLMTAALVYSQKWFNAVAPLYHGLMLIFLAGMVGLCLTGDLFNMFVFFELMSVPAYALTGYKTQERGPAQGGLNFAISNSVGGFLTLTGIALIYGRTGALNLAQIGQTLGAHGADGLVVVGFVLVLCGFLVKAAAVPFHFWLADAHATAPAPVSVLFSGIMVQLGLFAVARIYWTAFSGVHGLDGEVVRTTFLVLGVVGALVGAVMAMLEDHLKRLLAFSTISHTGLFLIGFAMLEPHGLSGAAIYVLAHGCTKGALFMLCGIVAHRLGSVAERELHGRGRQAGMWATGALFVVGGFALASLPPFGTFLGKALTEEAATEGGYGWAPIVFLLASAMTGAAVLRAGAGIFLGWGDPRPPARGEQGESTREAEEGEADESGGTERTPWVMWLPACALMICGLALPVVPRLADGFDSAATHFQDRAGYVTQVLHGHPAPQPAMHPPTGPHASSYLWGAGSVLLALALAAFMLYAPRLLQGEGAAHQAGERVALVLRRWHSGHIGDYVTWLVVGLVALLCAMAAAT
jgi:multicomponent Na+:H+ antiporter subunit D